MGWHLPSYRPVHDGHDHHCYHGNEPGEPCYGQVRLTDEECLEDYSDCWDIYQCEAHVDCHCYHSGWAYKVSAHAEDSNQLPCEDDR